MQLVLAVSQWRSLTIGLVKHPGLCWIKKQSLYTPGALLSLSLSFHPRPGFLRRSNTKLRAVKHLGMCSLLRIYFGKRILSSFFFNNFGHSKSTHHWRFCYALPKILIMKLMLLFKCRRRVGYKNLKTNETVQLVSFILGHSASRSNPLTFYFPLSTSVKA